MAHLKKQIYLSGRTQTSQTGGKVYSDTSPYKVSEYSRLIVILPIPFHLPLHLALRVAV